VIKLGAASVVPGRRFRKKKEVGAVCHVGKIFRGVGLGGKQRKALKKLALL